ncbi:MAG: 2-amino-4-hydroxy-6-hydroxymethyldihydropteridine diphosphokinase [Chlorobi bacterium]|nr:2-amino-4-hydroxy-6-hydroxymethyldihydropteridine diphosphokinase [Chlorobiota bacterium]
MGRLILLLGGNEGDTKKILSHAQNMLNDEIGPVQEISSLYESEPWGFKARQNFINQVIEIDCSLEPDEILKKTQQIEKKLGRTLKSTNGYSSRIIDIDILFYNNISHDTQELKIPHPQLHKRLFTLLPLSEKWNDLIHPVIKKEVGQLLTECDDSGWVKKI